MTFNNFSDLEEIGGPPNKGGPPFSPPKGVSMPTGDIPKIPNIPKMQSTGVGGFTPPTQAKGGTGGGVGGFGSPMGMPQGGTMGRPAMGMPQGTMGRPNMGIPQGGFQNQQQSQAEPEKVFVPLNKELQSRRENAIKKFTQTVFSSFEIIPSLVGTVDCVPFTQTLLTLSALLCVSNILYGTLFGFTTLFRPLQLIIVVAINGLWYIYSVNTSTEKDIFIEEGVGMLPDLKNTSILQQEESTILDTKHDIPVIKPIQKPDINLTQPKPVEKPLSNFNKPTSEPVPTVNSTNANPNTKSSFSKPNLDIVNEFKSFTENSIEGFGNFDFSDLAIDNDTDSEKDSFVESDDWEVVSDTKSTPEESSKLPKEIKEEPNAKIDESKAKVNESKANLFEDPDDLEINLDDFIPKSVDTTGARDVSFDNIINEAQLSDNMKSIESMGSEIANLISLLGQI